MQGYALIGIAVVVGMALVKDASGTLRLVIIIVTSGGVTYILKNIVSKMDIQKAQLISFSGWCIMGTAMAGILKNSLFMVRPVMNFVGKVGETIGSVGMFLDKIMVFADKATFWN
jgi:hypothetical protein